MIDNGKKQKTVCKATPHKIELILNDGISYNDLITFSEDKILNLFFFSGYLTQTNLKGRNDDVVYTIKIPNKEIKKILCIQKIDVLKLYNKLKIKNILMSLSLGDTII